MIQGIRTGPILPLMFAVAMQIFHQKTRGGQRDDGLGDHVCARDWATLTGGLGGFMAVDLLVLLAVLGCALLFAILNWKTLRSD